MTMATLGADMVVAGAVVTAGAGADEGDFAGAGLSSSSEWLFLRRLPGKHMQNDGA